MNKNSKSSLLKDNSWIRKVDDEDDPVDQDPNFGRSVLNRHKSNETLVSPQDGDNNNTRNTSVQALSKRFSGSRDELKNSTFTSSTNTSSSSRSTTTTTITKDGKTTETTITTTQNVSSPISKTPTKTETFTERVKASSKGPQYSTYSPTRTSKVTETTVLSNKDAEDKLYDTLLPSSIKDNFSPADSKTSFSKTETVIVKGSDTGAEDKLYDDVTNGKSTISSTETVTVKSSINGDDDLYDSLVFKDPKYNLSSLSRSSVTKREFVTVDSSSRGYSSYTDDVPPTRTTSYTISTTPSTDRTYSYSRTDSSITSPSVYTSSSYKSSSRSDEILSDPIYSKSSIKSVYTSPERPVLEKDLCTSCRKPFTGDAKIVLDDMKINCHASCFKCDVCNNTLGHLKAGDSMWIYKRMVHCENCFEITREKWKR